MTSCCYYSLVYVEYNTKFYCMLAITEDYGASPWGLTVQRALPLLQNKLSHVTTTCKYVNSTTHATVFNLQQYELSLEARLSIKFAHSDWRIICKKT